MNADYIPANHDTVDNDGTTTTTNCDDAVWEYFVQLHGKSPVGVSSFGACMLIIILPTNDKATSRTNYTAVSEFVVQYFV
jgi:hypothetical protein